MTTTITVNQVIAALTTFSQEELVLINKTLIGLHKAKRNSPHDARAQANAMAKAQWNRGDDVEFTNSKSKQVIKGKIIKIVQKNVHVQTPEQAKSGQHWVVPPLMLRKQS